MSINTIIKKLTAAGLEYKEVQIYNPEKKGIMVYHDYSGIYPTEEAFRAHEKATAIARKYKAYSEPRGHYTATLIIV